MGCAKWQARGARACEARRMWYPRVGRYAARTTPRRQGKVWREEVCDGSLNVARGALAVHRRTQTLLRGMYNADAHRTGGFAHVEGERFSWSGSRRSRASLRGRTSSDPTLREMIAHRDGPSCDPARHACLGGMCVFGRCRDALHASVRSWSDVHLRGVRGGLQPSLWGIPAVCDRPGGDTVRGHRRRRAARRWGRSARPRRSFPRW